MENGKITIYDVAERAGVSIATVSRAMSGGSISAKSRQKVQEAIEALHYQPSTAHSHPQGQEKRTGTLALVIGDFDNPYCSMLMRGAELEATRHGYALEVFCHTPGTITNDQM
ncbi:MAG: LacI family DNA-binding transcriptional regulator, partial [Christensenellales bacterium]|nr:LacI family DNA-binding transcriptional regulator [Christensenellales bacterium]